MSSRPIHTPMFLWKNVCPTVGDQSYITFSWRDLDAFYTEIIGRQLNIGSDAVPWYWALSKGGKCEFETDEETSFNI